MMKLDGAQALNRLMDLWTAYKDPSRFGLTPPQFVTAMLQVLPRSRGEAQVALVADLLELFREVDVNGDREMEWEELTSFVAEMGIIATKRRAASSRNHYTERPDWIDTSTRGLAIERMTVVEWPHPSEADDGRGADAGKTDGRGSGSLAAATAARNGLLPAKALYAHALSSSRRYHSAPIELWVIESDSSKVRVYDFGARDVPKREGDSHPGSAGGSDGGRGDALVPVGRKGRGGASTLALPSPAVRLTATPLEVQRLQMSGPRREAVEAWPRHWRRRKHAGADTAHRPESLDTRLMSRRGSEESLPGVATAGGDDVESAEDRTLTSPLPALPSLASSLPASADALTLHVSAHSASSVAPPTPKGPVSTLVLTGKTVADASASASASATPHSSAAVTVRERPASELFTNEALGLEPLPNFKVPPPVAVPVEDIADQEEQEAEANKRRRRKQGSAPVTAGVQISAPSSLKLKYEIDIASVPDLPGSLGGDRKDGGLSASGAPAVGDGSRSGGSASTGSATGAKSKEPGAPLVHATCFDFERQILAIAQSNSRISLWRFPSFPPPPSLTTLEESSSDKSSSSATAPSSSSSSPSSSSSSSTSSGSGPTVRVVTEDNYGPDLLPANGGFTRIDSLFTFGPINVMACSRGVLYGATSTEPGVVTAWDLQLRVIIHRFQHQHDVITDMLAISPEDLGVRKPRNAGDAASDVIAGGAELGGSSGTDIPGARGMFITASMDRTTAVTDLAANGAELRVLQEAQQRKNAMRAMLASGRRTPLRSRVVSVSDTMGSLGRGAKPMDATSSSMNLLNEPAAIEPGHGGKLVALLRGHSRGVRQLCYVASAGLLITAAFELDAIVWELPGCKEAMRLKGHRLPIIGVREVWEGRGGMGLGGASPLNTPKTLPLARRGGRGGDEDAPVQPRVVTMDQGGNFRVWDLGIVPTGVAVCLQSFDISSAASSSWAHYFPASFCANRVTGEVVAAGSKMHHYLPSVSVKQDAGVALALFNPTTQLFLVAGGAASDGDDDATGSRLGSLRVFSAAGTVLPTLNDLSRSPITALAFDDRQRKLILGNQNGHVQVHNARTGALMKHGDSPHSPGKEVSAIVYVDEDKTVVTASWDRKLRVHDEAPPHACVGLRTAWAAQEADILSCDVSRDLGLIASGAADGSIRVHDYEGMRLEGTCFGHADEVTAVKFVVPFPLVLAADGGGTLALWGVRGCSKSHLYKPIVVFQNLKKDRRGERHVRGANAASKPTEDRRTPVPRDSSMRPSGAATDAPRATEAAAAGVGAGSLTSSPVHAHVHVVDGLTAEGASAGDDWVAHASVGSEVSDTSVEAFHLERDSHTLFPSADAIGAEAAVADGTEEGFGGAVRQEEAFASLIAKSEWGAPVAITAVALSFWPERGHAATKYRAAGPLASSATFTRAGMATATAAAGSMAGAGGAGGAGGAPAVSSIAALESASVHWETDPTLGIQGTKRVVVIGDEDGRIRVLDLTDLVRRTGASPYLRGLGERAPSRAQSRAQSRKAARRVSVPPMDMNLGLVDTSIDEAFGPGRATSGAHGASGSQHRASSKSGGGGVDGRRASMTTLLGRRRRSVDVTAALASRRESVESKGRGENGSVGPEGSVLSTGAALAGESASRGSAVSRAAKPARRRRNSLLLEELQRQTLIVASATSASASLAAASAVLHPRGRGGAGGGGPGGGGGGGAGSVPLLAGDEGGARLGALVSAGASASEDPDAAAAVAITSRADEEDGPSLFEASEGADYITRARSELTDKARRLREGRGERVDVTPKPAKSPGRRGFFGGEAEGKASGPQRGRSPDRAGGERRGPPTSRTPRGLLGASSPSSARLASTSPDRSEPLGSSGSLGDVHEVDGLLADDSTHGAGFRRGSTGTVVDEAYWSANPEELRAKAMAVMRARFLHADVTAGTKVLASWRGHMAPVTSIQAIRDPPSLLTCSADGAVKVWSMHGEPLGVLLHSRAEMQAIRRGFANPVPWRFRVDADARRREQLEEARELLREMKDEVRQFRSKADKRSAVERAKLEAHRLLLREAPGSPLTRTLQRMGGLPAVPDDAAGSPAASDGGRGELGDETPASAHGHQEYLLAAASVLGVERGDAEEATPRPATRPGSSEEEGEKEWRELTSPARLEEEALAAKLLEDVRRGERSGIGSALGTSLSAQAGAGGKGGRVGDALAGSVSAAALPHAETTDPVSQVLTHLLDREREFALHQRARERAQAILAQRALEAAVGVMEGTVVTNEDAEGGASGMDEEGDDGAHSSAAADGHGSGGASPAGGGGGAGSRRGSRSTRRGGRRRSSVSRSRRLSATTAKLAHDASHALAHLRFAALGSDAVDASDPWGPRGSAADPFGWGSASVASTEGAMSVDTDWSRHRAASSGSHRGGGPGGSRLASRTSGLGSSPSDARLGTSSSGRALTAQAAAAVTQRLDEINDEERRKQYEYVRTHVEEEGADTKGALDASGGSGVDGERSLKARAKAILEDFDLDAALLMEAMSSERQAARLLQNHLAKTGQKPLEVRYYPNLVAESQHKPIGGAGGGRSAGAKLLQPTPDYSEEDDDEAEEDDGDERGLGVEYRSDDGVGLEPGRTSGPGISASRAARRRQRQRAKDEIDLTPSPFLLAHWDEVFGPADERRRRTTGSLRTSASEAVLPVGRPPRAHGATTHHGATTEAARAVRVPSHPTTDAPAGHGATATGVPSASRPLAPSVSAPVLALPTHGLPASGRDSGTPVRGVHAHDVETAGGDALPSGRRSTLVTRADHAVRASGGSLAMALAQALGRPFDPTATGATSTSGGTRSSSPPGSPTLMRVEEAFVTKLVTRAHVSAVIDKNMRRAEAALPVRTTVPRHVATSVIPRLGSSSSASALEAGPSLASDSEAAGRTGAPVFNAKRLATKKKTWTTAPPVDSLLGGLESLRKAISPPRPSAIAPFPLAREVEDVALRLLQRSRPTSLPALRTSAPPSNEGGDGATPRTGAPTPKSTDGPTARGGRTHSEATSHSGSATSGDKGVRSGSTARVLSSGGGSRATSSGEGSRVTTLHAAAEASAAAFAARSADARASAELKRIEEARVAEGKSKRPKMFGSIPLTDVESAWKVFRRLDRDGNGRVDPREFSQANAWLGSSISTVDIGAQAGSLFRSMDTDRDLGITVEEFFRAVFGPLLRSKAHLHEMLQFMRDSEASRHAREEKRIAAAAAIVAADMGEGFATPY